jgi:hypothetical protein
VDLCQLGVADLSVGVADLNVHLRVATSMVGLTSVGGEAGRQICLDGGFHGGEIVGSLLTWICDVS